MPGSIAFSGSALGRSLFILGVAFMFSSCANIGAPSLQPQVNGFIMANQPKMAAERITAQAADYGFGNYVLYHLDRSLVLQMNDDHAGSVESLEKAKARYEELYTHSLANEAATWMVNDNMSPYRAPGYERVLMNVFQAFNYVKEGALDEALVEARDLDSKFPVDIDAFVHKKRQFEDNGFARLLTGILYEARGKSGDLNEALIAYKQALAVYDAYYGGKYVPQILAEGLIRLAGKFNDPALRLYRTRFAGFAAVPAEGRAIVYLFEAVGFSPVKAQDILPVPLEEGLVAKIAFPKFMRRDYAARSSELLLDADNGAVIHAPTELGMDIEDLAVQDLAARKALILSKAVLRPAMKYLVERNQKEAIEKKHGVLAGEAFGLLSSLYNIFTEQADVRSWQALPGQIRVARLVVSPGAYHVKGRDMDALGTTVDHWDVGQLQLVPGQVHCIFRRSVR